MDGREDMTQKMLIIDIHLVIKKLIIEHMINFPRTQFLLSIEYNHTLLTFPNKNHIYFFSQKIILNYYCEVISRTQMDDKERK